MNNCAHHLIVRSDSILDDVILRLRKHVSRDEKHGEGIEQIFSRIDRDNDGEVDVYEFEAALDKIGALPLVSFSSAQC